MITACTQGVNQAVIEKAFYRPASVNGLSPKDCQQKCDRSRHYQPQPMMREKMKAHPMKCNGHHGASRTIPRAYLETPNKT